MKKIVLIILFSLTPLFFVSASFVPTFYLNNKTKQCTYTVSDLKNKNWHVITREEQEAAGFAYGYENNEIVNKVCDYYGFKRINDTYLNKWDLNIWMSIVAIIVVVASAIALILSEIKKKQKIKLKTWAFLPVYIFIFFLIIFLIIFIVFLSALMP